VLSSFQDGREQKKSGYIDAGKKVTHERLAEEIEGKLEDNKWWKTLKPLVLLCKGVPRRKKKKSVLSSFQGGREQKKQQEKEPPPERPGRL
jgi:hypothetical protein